MSRLARAMVAGMTFVLVAIGGSLAIPKPSSAPPPSAAPSGGPGASEAPPVVYREGVVGQPGSITPITARTRSERTLVGLIFSGLVKLGPDNTFQPDLAATWDVDDSGQVWVFHIRPDANWQDGAPVTADDVAFTVDALKTADASGVEAAAWAEVDVKVLDTKTVQFTLGSPIAGFLAALTQPLLPKHLLDGQPIADLATSQFARQPVGSGPYVLISLDQDMAVLVPTLAQVAGESPGASPSDSPAPSPTDPAGPTSSPSASPGGSGQAGAVPGDAAALLRTSGIPGAVPPSRAPAAATSPSASPSKSPRPSGSPRASVSPSPAPTDTPAPTPTPVPAGARIQRIEVHFYDNASALSDAFHTGALDAAAGLPQADITDLAALPGVERLRYPTTTLSAVLLNLSITQTTPLDANVRHALLAAIDRSSLANSVLGGDAARADALVPPTSWAFDAKASAPLNFDLAAAATLLKKAGWAHSATGWTAPKAKAPYTIELLTVTPAASDRLAKIATFVRDAWTALGFSVSLVELDSSELSSRLHDGSYTAAVVDIAMGVEPDLFSLLDSTQVRSTGANLSNYQDTSLDTLLEAARAPAAADKRIAAWSALEAGLAQRLPILPLVWHDDVVVARGVNGVGPRLISGPGDRFWDVLSWRLAAAG